MLKPQRDLSTPRGRLEFIRDVVVGTPAHKIDMNYYASSGQWDSCGCAMHHARLAGLKVPVAALGGGVWAKWLGLDEDETRYVFATRAAEKSYPIPTGAPAKAEFLKRIDKILASSC